jgi:hypothetical protein
MTIAGTRFRRAGFQALVHTALVGLVTTTFSFTSPVSVQAAPLTVDFVRRLTYVCDLPVFDTNLCPSDNSIVNFSVTYDPDTLVVLDGPGGERIVQTTGPLSYTISIPALDIPWGGPIIRFDESATLTYLTPNVAALQLVIHDFSPDADAAWDTRFGLGLLFSPDVAPGSPADEFYAALTHDWVPGDFFYMSYRTFIRNYSDNSFEPGSRLYYTEVPEPAAGALLITALVGAAWRRWRH